MTRHDDTSHVLKDALRETERREAQKLRAFTPPPKRERESDLAIWQGWMA